MELVILAGEQVDVFERPPRESIKTIAQVDNNLGFNIERDRPFDPAKDKPLAASS